MGKCDYCGATILFGGVKDGNYRFCNDKCHQRGYVVTVAGQIPDEVVRKAALEIHSGFCPRCGGRGPVDVHMIHKIWSAFLMTSWSSTPQISCRSCGVKGILGGTAFSFFLGWWGVPWGFIMTPVQVSRNVYGLLKGNEHVSRPSEQLEKLVRMDIAVRGLNKQ